MLVMHEELRSSVVEHDRHRGGSLPVAMAREDLGHGGGGNVVAAAAEGVQTSPDDYVEPLVAYAWHLSVRDKGGAGNENGLEDLEARGAGLPAIDEAG